VCTPEPSDEAAGAPATAAARRRWWSSCTLSLGLHTLVLVGLALLSGRSQTPVPRQPLVTLPARDDGEIDFEPVELVDEPVVPTRESATLADAIEPLPATLDPPGPEGPAATLGDAAFDALVPEVDDSPLAIAVGDLGLALTRGEEGAGFDDEGAGAEVEFYGVKASGRRFVFVTDCSGSMDGYPLLRLKEQLHAVLGDLPARIEFFIVFFNHGPIPLPVKGCLAATDAHKRRALAWVDAIQADGGTDPSQALAIALALEPSVVFLLTDGMFPPEPAFQAIAQRNRGRRAQINTIAIGQQGAEPVLRRIAAENRGDYRFVPF